MQDYPCLSATAVPLGRPSWTGSHAGRVLLSRPSWGGYLGPLLLDANFPKQILAAVIFTMLLEGYSDGG